MTKNIVTAVILCTSFMYGMEPENKQWSITVYGTKINLTKDYLCDAYSKMNVDIMVLGTNQQTIMTKNGHFHPNEQEIGYEWYRGECEIYSRKNFQKIMGNQEIINKKISVDSAMRPRIYSFVEPCVLTAKGEEFVYYTCRKESLVRRPTKLQIAMNRDKNVKIVNEYTYDDGGGTFLCWEFCGKKANKEASKDLEKCYQIIFKMLSNRFQDTKITVALPALGIRVPDATLIAVSSILKHVKQYTDKHDKMSNDRYDRIELVVETDEEFDLYKKELIKQSGLIKKICLLHYLFTHKDSKNIFLSLPGELIQYIAQLFYRL